MAKRDLFKKIQQFEDLIKMNSAQTRSMQLNCIELKEIWDESKNENGNIDIFKVSTMCYAAGYMIGHDHGKKPIQMRSANDAPTVREVDVLTAAGALKKAFLMYEGSELFNDDERKSRALDIMADYCHQALKALGEWEEDDSDVMV